MAKNNDARVIIPVYNEADVIAQVVTELADKFGHIICVDDGSTDESVERIRSTGLATVVRHPINLGQGAALQTGVEFALQDPASRYFITFDADGQHQVKDAILLLETIKHEDVDIVLGSRFLGVAEGIGWLKKLILRAAVKFSNRTTGLRLTDSHNGLRAFNRQFAEKLNITMSDMTHASEIVHRIAEGKFKYQELPVTIRYTDYSKSKGQPILNSINITFDLMLNRFTKK